MKYDYSATPPRINDLTELAILLESTQEKIAKIINKPSLFYREFKIKKRSGTDRIIQAPKPELSFIQKNIYRNILSCVTLSDAAHGFVAGRSIVTHANCHINGREFLLTDIKDFFPSINLAKIINIFAVMGYNHDISTVLGLLTNYKDGLPQGAPTSPILSNIAALLLDVRLSEFAKNNQLIYSRYADDMSFSGDHVNFALLNQIALLIAHEGFEINNEKSLVATNRGKIIITGISLSRGRLHLPRESKRNLRKDVFFMLKNGIIKESCFENILDPLYVDRLMGRLSFWLQIEPTNEFALKNFRMLKKLVSSQTLSRAVIK